MAGRGAWPGTAAAAVVGAALGIACFAGGALLLYSGEGFLASAGFLMAVTLAALAAGVWVGGPDGPGPGHRRLVGRWMLAVAVLALASFVAMAWLRFPALQTSALGPPLGMVLFLAEPAYALGALLAGLAGRGGRGGLDALRSGRRPAGGRGGVAVPALLGAGVGAVVAAAWLIPAMPPGPVFFGTALLLMAAGTADMAFSDEAVGATMTDGVVLITGVGGRGQVGYALAEAFRGAGARVVLAGRGEGAEARASELGGDVVAVRVDLTTPEGAAAAVDAARQQWGRLDVVVNAAGGLRVMKPLAETSPEEWADEVDRNARTAFLVSRAALPLLREARGAIVNFASPAVDRPVKGLGAYLAAKAGVAALTRAMALEEKPNGVRVNAVAPGMIDTAQNRASVENPDGRSWVSREAVAEAVLFLATARGVTGEVVDVTNADLKGAGPRRVE